MKNGQFSTSSSNHLTTKTTSTTINSFPTILNKECQEKNVNMNGKELSKKSVNKIKQSVKFDSSNSNVSNENNLSDPLLSNRNSNEN
jgi:hypothetical protein